MKCCATCKYWYGDKENAETSYNVSKGQSFDLIDGWVSEGGECKTVSEGLLLEIIGSTKVYIYTRPNFACSYYVWDGERVFIDGVVGYKEAV